jgi:4-cresol dehydrogenase (hydroxylating) flavoprotein subunit
MSDLPSSKLGRALVEWRTILGADHVVADGPALAAADRACCGRSGGVAAIIFPADEFEACRCLAAAHRNQLPVHPVSLGHNWGYGSRQPPEPPAVVLSLQRLNDIGALNEQNGQVTLQPGVTFGALGAWLRSDKPAWLSPEIGAGPNASVVGNALAGGFGKGPYGWTARRLTNIKFACSDGRIAWLDRLCTSSGGNAARLPHGAVALQGSFQLCKAPALRSFAWALLADGADALAAALELALQHAADHDGSEQSELLNGARLRLQCPGLFPHAGDRTHDAWLLAFNLWAQDESEMAWRQARAQRRLAALPAVMHSMEASVAVADLPPIGHEGLTSAYTLTGRQPPADADPDRDGCGVRWISPLLPRASAAAVTALDALGACAIAHDFAPALAVRLPDGDPVGLLGLFWNRLGTRADVASNDARAAACNAAFRAKAEQLGFTLYRQGPATTAIVPEGL